MREELDKAFEKDQFVPTTDLSLSEYIENFLKEIENGQRLIPFTGKRYTQGTIKNFKGFFAQIKAYQKKKRKKLRFDDITTDFYDLFVQFFNSKDYSPNTIGRHIKNLKTIMRTARDEGFHNNSEFERKQFKTLKVDSPSIYLSEKELAKIEALELSDQPVLEVSRDIFLIGCYTAQRFKKIKETKNQLIVTIILLGEVFFNQKNLFRKTQRLVELSIF